MEGEQRHLDVKVYSSRRKESFLKTLFGSILGFKEGFGLGIQLAKRDIKAMYRQSFLGLFWAVITPVAQMFLWIFLNSRGVLDIDDTGVPYPLFVLTGIMLWQTLLEAINSPLTMYHTSKSILRKINIPKEALLIAGMSKVLFSLAIKLVVVCIMMIYFQLVVDWTIVLGLIGIVFMIVFGFTIGIWITPIGALYTDVQRFIQSFAQLLFFLTPIIYPARETGVFGLMDKYNPAAIVVCNARDMLFCQGVNDVSIYLVTIALTTILLALGLIIFNVSLPVIVERSGA